MHRIVTFCLEDKHNLNKMYSQKVIFLNFFLIFSSLFCIVYLIWKPLGMNFCLKFIRCHSKRKVQSQKIRGWAIEFTRIIFAYSARMCVFCKLWSLAFLSIIFEAQIAIILFEIKIGLLILVHETRDFSSR